MPVAGVSDPSHKERKTDEPGRLPNWFTPDQLLHRAAGAEPGWGPWSYELLAAALAHIQERGDNISTTALTSACPRSTVLERKESYIADLDNLWRAFRGTLIHRTLELSARPGAVAETRFFAELPNGGELSCSPDLIEGFTMWDYKNTKQNPSYNYPYRSHTTQLQVNRWVVNNATRWEKDDKPFDIPFNPRELNFRHLVVMYLDIDGPKPLETPYRKVTLPDGKFVREPYIWSDDEVLEWVTPRYDALRSALDAYPEWPDGVEEVWGGEPGYTCPGPPLCKLPNCLAKRFPHGLVW